MRLLLVGPTPRLQEECERLAAKHDLPYQVEVADTEDAAIARLDDGEFDLVLCDCTHVGAEPARIFDHADETCVVLAIDGTIANAVPPAVRRKACPWVIDMADDGEIDQALERVVRCRCQLAEHEQIEETLEEARRDLEARIEQRTAVLKATVWELRQEVVRRASAEVSLHAEKERFRTLVETIPHGIVELDATGAYTFANAVYHRLLGLPEGSLDGRKFWEPWKPAEVAGRAEEIVRAIIERQPKPARFFATIVNDRQERVALEIDWNYKRDDSARVAGLVAVVSDITAQRRAEEQAQEHLNALAHVTRLSTMGEMVSGLAHELNQPLTTISNYAQACRHYVKTLSGDCLPDLQAAHGQILEQATRAGEIIRRLRAFVRRLESQREPADANQMVRDVLVLLEVESRVRDVAIRLDLAEALQKVHVDRIQIEQVITNLVKNAMEASDDAPDDCRAVTVRTLAGDGGVEVSVVDAGKGLSSEDLHHMFEPFYTTKREGMGLGLSISRSIIEAHGGRLDASRNADRGSTFRFSLPLNSEGDNA